MTAVSPSANFRIVNMLPPASYAATATNGTGSSDHQGFYWATFMLCLGVLGATATVDVKIQESDVLGSGYADITGAAFSQKVKATDDNKIYLGELYLPPRKKFLRAVITVASNASLASVEMLLSSPVTGERVDKAQTASEALSAPIGTGLGIGAGVDFKVAA